MQPPGRGEGVAQDFKEAAKWFRQAAEQGNAKAQGALGVMYFRGEGVAQDSKEAAKWYRQAAEQGNAGAQHFLGGMYSRGDGVPKDDVVAYAWFNIAAANGQAEAAGRRDALVKTMTREQIAEGQKLSRELFK